MLQEKLNTYLRFIESGEIYTAYEDSVGRKFEIVIHFKENYPQSCKAFLESVREIIESAGFMFLIQLDNKC
ncbi:hypothetical protein KZ483_06180 [Paenibacillus sp. sptzw28]|nr:hypothetical protein KZ483_06180 [Paenibacillus sp. sptzw28]